MTIRSRRNLMAYTAKEYAALIGMEGFSETLLKNHFTLYQGYVTNTNKVLDSLKAMLADGKAATPEFAELKRVLDGSSTACGCTNSISRISAARVRLIRRQARQGNCSRFR